MRAFWCNSIYIIRHLRHIICSHDVTHSATCPLYFSVKNLFCCSVLHMFDYYSICHVIPQLWKLQDVCLQLILLYPFIHYFDFHHGNGKVTVDFYVNAVECNVTVVAASWTCIPVVPLRQKKTPKVDQLQTTKCAVQTLICLILAQSKFLSR